MADSGVKAHAEGAEEGAAVDRPVVGVDHIAVGDDFQRHGDVDRNLEMAGQAVARPGGEYPQGRLCATQRAGGLIDCAVASAGQHAVVALGGGLPGQAGGVAACPGEAHVDIVAAGTHCLLHHFHHPFLRACPGDGVDDEHQSRHQPRIISR